MSQITAETVTITVNGKDFIVCAPSISRNDGSVYHTYFSTRDGKKFGPIRTANESGGAKSVGRQLTVAARAFFGPEVVDAAYVKAIESLTNRIAEINPAGRWAEADIACYSKQLAVVEAAFAARA